LEVIQDVGKIGKRGGKKSVRRPEVIVYFRGCEYTGFGWENGFSIRQHDIERVLEGEAMAQQEKHSDESSQPPANTLVRLADQNQLDFELEFFGGILEQYADYVDVLRVQGNNLTLKGRFVDGLQIDQRLVELRPDDPLAHYNLACSYALLKRTSQAIDTLRKAVELGYRDFRYLREDRDLDAIRHDPRFRQLLKEYDNR